ncbi:MAG: hypothetical protein N4A35_13665 [Flavobacteriales bacterium]|jgi:hypothetical protein|nr:hypothetical protein [Flavobacteriales bacterium]
MKKFIILFLAWTSLVIYSQEPTSFYFGAPQPANIETSSAFSSSICGKYVLEDDSLTQLYITPDSIYLQQNVLFMLSKKDFRKSKKKYYTQDGLLYGIVQNEGLPYVIQNDTTFAIYKQINNYFTPAPTTPLKQQNKTYYLNEQTEHGYYTTSMLYHFGKGIAIYSIDHELVLPQIRSFEQVDSLQLDGFKTYIATPSLKDMNTFVQQKGFRDVVIFFEPKYYIQQD